MPCPVTLAIAPSPFISFWTCFIFPMKSVACGVTASVYPELKIIVTPSLLAYNYKDKTSFF